MTLLTNLVAYWKLDESSGNASDSSGGGFTLTNNNSVTYAAGLINNGADFGASNSTKSLSITNDLGITGGNISISAWIKPTSLPANDPTDPTPSGRFTIVWQEDGGNGVANTIHLSQVGGVQKVIYSRWRQGIAIQVSEVNHTTSTSTWTHVVATYDGVNGRCYVNNGTPGVTAMSGNGNPTSDRSAIGFSPSGNVAYFSGMVDEVGVWSKALTAGEITQLYNSGNGLSYPFTSSNSNFFAFF